MFFSINAMSYSILLQVWTLGLLSIDSGICFRQRKLSVYEYFSSAVCSVIKKQYYFFLMNGQNVTNSVAEF